MTLSVSRDVSSEEDGEDGVAPRKKKRKKKQKKKHKKKSGRYSHSSASDSETIYPSDLKKEQEAKRYTNIFNITEAYTCNFIH